MDSQKLILGTVQFGLDYGINNQRGKPSQAQVFDILQTAWEAGVDTLDTADAYGNAAALIGKFHQTVPYRFWINTKFKLGVEQRSLRSQFDQSLESLHVKTIDAYFFHNFADFINYPKALVELKNLKEEGNINQIGVSVYGNDEFAMALEHDLLDVIQIPFNVLDNVSQRGKLMEEARARGKQIQVRSVFLQGLLFKKTDTLPAQLLPLKKYITQFLAAVQTSGKSLEAVCLAYANGQPMVDRIIVGVDSKEHLLRNIEQVETKIPSNIMRQIDAIFVNESELLYPKNWL